MFPAFDAHLFFSTFALIFVAEWPDKTAFATLLMATQRNPVAIFVGVAGAFLIQTVVAVAFGSLFALLPHKDVRIGAGALFLVFAIAMWLKKEVEEEEKEIVANPAADFWKTVSGAFVVIFLAEWGDLTQLATAALEAKYRNPLTILPGALLALWSVTALAILIGHHARKLVNPYVLQKVAAVAFAVVGVLLLVHSG